MRRVLVIPLLVTALLAGGSLYAWADHPDQLPADCENRGEGANITEFGGNYRLPAVAGQPSGEPGTVTLDLDLAGESCYGVTYGVVVLEGGVPQPPAAGESGVEKTVLASSSVIGDGETQNYTFKFQLPVFTPTVCIYATTSGATGGSSTGKTGQAFDGQASTLIDRAPNDVDPDFYCAALTGAAGGQGYH